jgi:hypothetical protein
MLSTGFPVTIPLSPSRPMTSRICQSLSSRSSPVTQKLVACPAKLDNLRSEASWLVCGEVVGVGGNQWDIFPSPELVHSSAATRITGITQPLPQINQLLPQLPSVHSPVFSPGPSAAASRCSIFRRQSSR